jgi:hypothetical protein
MAISREKRCNWASALSKQEDVSVKNYKDTKGALWQMSGANGGDKILLDGENALMVRYGTISLGVILLGTGFLICRTNGYLVGQPIGNTSENVSKLSGLLGNTQTYIR